MSRQPIPLFPVKISARDIFLNFCYFPPHFFFAVPPHSPATLLLPSEVSKGAEGRSANPVGHPTPFSSPLCGKDRERPFPPVSTNQLSSRNRQTNRYTHRKRGEKGFLLYEVWIEIAILRYYFIAQSILLIKSFVIVAVSVMAIFQLVFSFRKGERRLKLKNKS